MKIIARLILALFGKLFDVIARASALHTTRRIRTALRAYAESRYAYGCGHVIEAAELRGAGFALLLECVEKGASTDDLSDIVQAAGMKCGAGCKLHHPNFSWDGEQSEVEAFFPPPMEDLN